MRPATLDDAELATDIMAATYPALAHDPVVMRLRWENMRAGFSAGRFIGELDGRPIAFLAWIHGPWEKLPGRHCEVEVWLDRAAMDRDLLRSMWTWIADRAVADGALLLLAYAAEDELEALDVLAELGYARERLERVWELDLATHGPRLVKEAAEARTTMSGEGIALTTLAAWNDPTKQQKLYELNERTVQDIPHTLPIIPETLADFEKRLKAPDRPHDRFWVAHNEQGPVAMSYLKYPPVRGTVWTGYTCSHPDFRGRGIARAVKLQTLAQAVELGVPFVYTDNDSQNAPMLHINETLGYQRRPGFVEHHKRVTKKDDA
jgi:RimJ/RimL family protein N-acetyltransferase